MQQAAGREFELPDRFTQLVLNSFGRNMQAACDFFNGQSLFPAVLENHPAMGRQLFHFLLQPFKNGLIMEGCFDMTFSLRSFGHATFRFFPFADRALYFIKHSIFHGNGQVVFNRFDMTGMTIGPEGSEHIMYDIFSSCFIAETVMGDHEQFFPVPLIELGKSRFIVPYQQGKQFIGRISCVGFQSSAASGSKIKEIIYSITF